MTTDTPILLPGEPKPIIPSLASFYVHARDLSYLVVRLTAGGMLLVHGIQKVMPMAEKASPRLFKRSRQAAWLGAGSSPPSWLPTRCFSSKR